MIKRRRRFKQTDSLQDRLTAFAADMKAKAEKLPPGPEKADLIRRAREADTATQLNEWAFSPGLQSPK